MADEPNLPVPEPASPAPAPTASPKEAEPEKDWETRFKYLYADFENFRRRTERERESLSRQSRAGILRDLLPLIEAFRSAHASALRLSSNDPLRRGLELLDQEWEKFLRHQGIEPVAHVGGPFRSEEAEAVGEATVTDEAPDGSVAEIVQQGYRFFGGVLRPAKVIVARSRPESDNSDLAEVRSDAAGGPEP